VDALETDASIGSMTTSAVFAQFPTPTPGSNPAQIALGADGNLWFTEQQGQKIGRLVP
jgi:virginiamycin B lyase